MYNQNYADWSVRGLSKLSESTFISFRSHPYGKGSVLSSRRLFFNI